MKKAKAKAKTKTKTKTKMMRSNFKLFKLVIFFIFFLALVMVLPFGKQDNCYALAVDEKLPLRILKVSESKQTVLINRGVEDGLVAGDHARFYLTTGVVARGVALKVSPTRSVWSIYRLVSPEEIEENKVMNLKITPPVKLTNDPTKALAREEVGEESPINIPLDEGANDLDDKLTAEEKKDLKALASNLADVAPYITQKNWEVWSLFHLTMLKTNNSPGSNKTGTSGSDKSIDFFLGVERYFLTQDRWYSRLSFHPFIQYGAQAAGTVEGHNVGNGLMGIGIGLSWHFGATPLAVGKLIFPITFSFTMGTSEDTSTISPESRVVPAQTLAYKGNFSSFALGGGFKYYFGHNLGLRVIFDYYQRTETYVVAESSDNYVKVASGPRLFIGLGYRF